MYKNKNLKFKKYFCIFVVFFLISVTFSSAVSSKRLFDSSSIKYKIEEKIDDFQTGISNLRDNLNKNKFSSDEKPVLSKAKNLFCSLKEFIHIRTKSFSLTDSILRIYTDYEGIKKDQALSFGLSQKIDVDDDGDKDISALLTLFPGIETPLALSLNFKLKISRLNGFNDINAFFETYVKIDFPGFLYAEMQNDFAGFGYQSEKGEEVPDQIEITYKYIPYIFKLDKPVHILDFNPGLFSDVKDLSLLFLYDNPQNNSYVNNKWIIDMNPAVKSTITFKGEFGQVGRFFEYDSSSSTDAIIRYERFMKSEDERNVTTFNAGLIIEKLSDFTFEMLLTPFKRGGGKIEYIRKQNDYANVTLFFENNDSACIFVEEIPNHVKLSWNPALDGIIELNSYGTPLGRVGIRNSIDPSKATTYAYVENLPSLVQLKWNWKILNGYEIDFFVNSSNTKAYLYSNDLLGSGFEIEGSFISNSNFDFTIFWDFSDKTFGIKRSNINVSLDLSVRQNTGLSFNISAEIKNTITNPFEINFEEILQASIDISFTGNSVEILNLDANLYIPGTGRFFVEMYKFKLSRESTVTFSYSVTVKNGKKELNLTIIVTNGVEIRGLVVGYDIFSYPLQDIDKPGYYSHSLTLSFDEGTIKYWFGPGLSEGYICISGGILLSFESIFKDDQNQLIGEIVGSVAFENEGEELNISWSGQDFTIDGSGVLSLSGFYLRLKDKIEISIPRISGGFRLDSTHDSGRLRLYVDQSNAMWFGVNVDFSISGLEFYNFLFKGDFTLDFGLFASGCIDIEIQSGTFNIKSAEGTIGYNGFLNVDNIYLKMPGMDPITCNKFTLTGKFSFDISLYDMDFSMASFQFSATQGTTLIVWALNVPDLVRFDNVLLYGSGSIELNFPQDYINFNCAFGLDVDVVVPGSGNLLLKLNGYVSNLLIYGLLAGGNLRISKGSGSISISDFYININNGYIIASWDKFNLNGYGSIWITPQLKIDATITNIMLTNFYAYSNELNLYLDGSIDLTYAGETEIKATSDYLKIIFKEGTASASLTDLYIKSFIDNSELTLSLESLSIGGAGTFYVLTDFEDVLLGINAKGLIELNNFALNSNDYLIDGQLTASLGQFSVILDPIQGSDVRLSFGEEIKLIADGLGLGVQLIINDVNVFIEETQIGQISANLDNFNFIITGSAEIKFYKPSSDVYLVEGSIGTSSEFNINSLFIAVGEFQLSLSNLISQGQSNFQLSIDLDTINNNGKILASTSSLTTVGNFDIEFTDIEILPGSGLKGFGFDNFQIQNSFSLEILGIEKDSSGNSIFDLKLGIDGSWDSDGIYINTLKNGKVTFFSLLSYEGDIDIHFSLKNSEEIKLGITANEQSSVDFINFIPGFRLEINTFSATIDPGTIEISYYPEQLGKYQTKLEFDSTTSVYFDAFNFDPVNRKYEFHVLEFQLNPGVATLQIYRERLGKAGFIFETTATIKPVFDLFEFVHKESGKSISVFDVEFTVPYLNVEWDVDALSGNPDYSGFVSIDTGGQSFGVEAYIFDIIWFRGQQFSTNNWRFQWNFSRILYRFLERNKIDGEISADADVAIKVDGSWYSLFDTSTPEELNANLQPAEPFISNQQFKVHVSDIVGNVEGATVRYEKKTSLLYWEKVGEIKTTGSNGYTDDFYAEYTNVIGDNGRVKISYPGYSEKILSFRVNQGGQGFYAEAGNDYYQDVGEPVYFTGQAYNGITPYNWHWDFGDGSSSTIRNPSHVYYTSDNYIVTLTVTDHEGNIASDTAVAHIETTNSPPYFGNPPIDGPQTLCIGQNGLFIANILDDENDQLEYRWQYDHTPYQTGWFTNDNDYLTSWDFGSPPYQGWIKVQAREKNNPNHITEWSDPYPVSITEENLNPHALIDCPTTAYINEEVIFDGSDSWDSDGYIVTYEWGFGDGSTGSGISTSHIYSMAGNYLLDLVVTDDDGATSSTSKWIYIVQLPGTEPVADAGGPYNRGSAGPVQLDGSGSYDNDGDPLTYFWEFGDGETGTGVTPTHNYMSSGTYDLTLTVTDDDQRSDTDSTTVIIGGSGGAPYKPSTPYCDGSIFNVGYDIDFSTSTTDPDGDVIKYQFKFGNINSWWSNNMASGSTYTQSYSWNSPGVYDVIVRAKDNDGNIGPWSDPKTVTITNGNTQPPVANINIPSSAQVGETINFDGSNSYDPDGYITNYAWTFGDGQMGSGETTTHSYSSSGTFTATLTVTDDDGFTDTDTAQIQINDGVWISPSFLDDPEDFWNDENDACDGNDNSYSESDQYLNALAGYCDFIHFTVPYGKYTKVKFKVFQDDTYVSKIKIQRKSSSGGWFTLYEGEDFENMVWETKTFSGQFFDEIIVSFYMKRFLSGGPTAEIYEIELYKIQ